jgi:hypothetical protein
LANKYFSFPPFSALEKKEGRTSFSITSKNHSFREYSSFKTIEFIESKHLKVSETEVFPEYFKNTLMSNGAFFC